MVQHLITATKVAGLTYRLFSTATLIGLLGFAIFEAVKNRR
jgi:hypothetical protein